jgi:hypothetical protein
MKNTYTLKTIETLSGSIEILEMISPNGTISTVPLDPANSDYQRYLNPEADQPIGGNN